jgi:hypothetical protein
LQFLLVSDNEIEAKKRRFQDITEIQEQSLTVVHAIPKS